MTTNLYAVNSTKTLRAEPRTSRLILRLEGKKIKAVVKAGERTRYFALEENEAGDMGYTREVQPTFEQVRAEWHATGEEA